MNCRHCSSPLSLGLIDLGTAPHSNAYLSDDDCESPETWYPLRVLVCSRCWLVQTRDFADAAQLFSPDYAYHSSYSTSWLEHCRKYALAMIDRFSLSRKSHVIEVASNDGYLLQYFRDAGVPCLGVEPTAGTAKAARARGIETVEAFFGEELASKLAARGLSADLMTANNVLAHVPNVNDFVRGFSRLLKPRGAVKFEFPHLLNLMEGNQFDTIYHEHFSYFSFTSVVTVLSANGLRVFDVDRLTTHGGSLRVFAQRADSSAHRTTDMVSRLLDEEERKGVTTEAFYGGLQQIAERVKNDLVAFLIDAKRSGATVVGYGAAAKGNTLLNFAGCGPDLVRYVVDRNPAKQGKFMPGSRIPIVSEERIAIDKPDFILVLPWNLRDEIVMQLSSVRAWGGRFVTAVPRLEVSP